MSSDPFNTFAYSLADNLIQQQPTFEKDSLDQQLVRVPGKNNDVFELDLTPFKCKASDVSAMPFFDGVNDITNLLSAYKSAKSSLPFEMDIPEARENVDEYADEFVAMMLDKGEKELSNNQARIIGNWVKHLDVYCAVKAIESFLYSRADLKLLEIAPQYGWDVIYDHMAIRCGNGAHKDAERVAELLKSKHGYVSTQFPREAFYQFPDGWNAYPVYKMLKNGQALRVFVDQSDADDKSQIIQHWNRVYGYTTHHLGIRVTKFENGKRVAVHLDDIMAALEKEGIDIMTPTGQYTNGLLLQVFTRPEKNTDIPVELVSDIIKHGKQLEKVIENAKLLELVSRTEMDEDLAKQYYALYDLEFDANNPLHSAPIYQYFLPVQAAHVIRTSQEVK